MKLYHKNSDVNLHNELSHQNLQKVIDIMFVFQGYSLLVVTSLEHVLLLGPHNSGLIIYFLCIY